MVVQFGSRLNSGESMPRRAADLTGVASGIQVRVLSARGPMFDYGYLRPTQLAVMPLRQAPRAMTLMLAPELLPLW
ncbi:hypothetical protein ACWKSP_31920 [Micromonosporaceae bacterium Da 78-11]